MADLSNNGPHSGSDNDSGKGPGEWDPGEWSPAEKSMGEKRLERKIALARLFAGLERLWNRSLPLFFAAGGLAIFILSGLPVILPAAVKWLILSGLALALLGAFAHLVRIDLPSRQDAIRRLEQKTGLRHRPLSGLEDTLSLNDDNPQSQSLWQSHKQRLAQSVNRLKAGLPEADFAPRDPHALRIAVAISVIALGLLNIGDGRYLLRQTLATGETAADALYELDAWIAPPVYTAKPPYLLTGPQAEKRLADGAEILVPEGSKLIVRTNGAENPEIVLSRLNADNSAGEALSTTPLTGKAEKTVREAQLKLQRPVMVTIRDGARELGRWPVAIVPDAAPVVEITDEISLTASGSFAIPWSARDDYGIRELKSTYTLKPADSDGAATPLAYDTPGSPLSLPKLQPLKATGRAFQDLTKHPWAGLEVELRLTATDLAGQEGSSDAISMTLPMRQFHNVLSQILIEQRQNLVRDTGKRPLITQAMLAAMLWPDGLFEKSGHFLGWRQISRKLYNARSEEELRSLVDEMWELAIAIEDGDLSTALQELEALRRELQEALANGASPEKIAELTDKLRQTLNRYLEALARQGQENQRNGRNLPEQQLDPSQTLRSQDLQRMLYQIEQLAQSGARDAAQEMLSQLENILKNLRAGRPQQANPQRSTPGGRALQDLGELLRQQQELMDKTFRLPEGGTRSRPGQGQDNSAVPQARGQQGGESDRLANQQAELRQLLEDLINQLGQRGLNSPEALGQADQNMQGSEGNLREGERGQALSDQNSAIQRLREGAQSLAQELQQQGTGQQGNFGRHGEAKGEKHDPLGRPQRTTGEEYGPDHSIVPGEAAIQRAREILEYLRSRANEAQRPRIEKDYLERLLRGLY